MFSNNLVDLVKILKHVGFHVYLCSAILSILDSPSSEQCTFCRGTFHTSFPLNDLVV